MKESHENGQGIYLTSIFVMAVMSLQPTNCSSSTFESKDNGASRSTGPIGVVSSTPNFSPPNLESKVENNVFEMRLLDHLENHVTVLNDQVKEQKEKIDNLESIVDHLQSNKKDEVTENDTSHLHERIKRKPKTTNSSDVIPPNCKKDVCAFDYSRKTTLQLIENATLSLESVSLPNNFISLSQMGHTLSGIYAVQGSDANKNKVALTYCHFNSPLLKQNKDVPAVLEKQLGFFEMKSLPNRVAFFAQRDSKFESVKQYEVVLFTSLKINDGDAMDLKTGIFTAPVAGTYTFHFNGLGSRSFLYVTLKKNGETIGNAYADPGILVLSAIVKLVPGDKIFLSIYGNGFIMDNQHHHTAFSGWLIEEDSTL